MSQRSNGFRGGIKKGTTAFDEQSQALDRGIRYVSKQLENELAHQGYKRVNKFLSRDIPGGLASCQPDGGIWYNSKNQIVAIFEGKKQGAVGNAHERWYMNRWIAHVLAPQARYVTFCSGPGVQEHNSMYKGLSFALACEGKPVVWNVLHATGSSFYGQQQGFTDQELYNIMKQAITLD